jgi:hypothetical protein
MSVVFVCRPFALSVSLPFVSTLASSRTRTDLHAIESLPRSSQEITPLSEEMLVCLVCLVYLVCFVCLVCLVDLVRRNGKGETSVIART